MSTMCDYISSFPSLVSGAFASQSLAIAPAMSVIISTGWSYKYGSRGTIARPVRVGPHNFARAERRAEAPNAFLACATAVCIVNAGRALHEDRCGHSLEGGENTYM